MEQEKKYLSDVLEAIILIDDFTLDIAGFEQYQKDKKTKSAVERQLAIIGEAISKLDKLNINPLEHTAKIVAFRNRLIHAYDAIDDTMVWAVLKNHLEPLKIEAMRRLEE